MPFVQQCQLACLLFTILTLDHRAALAAPPPESPSVEQGKVADVFRKYCGSCHGDKDPEAGLSLSSLEKVVHAKSTEDRQLLVPGDLAGSLMLQMMTGEMRPQMPPQDEPQPSAKDIALVRDWIASGAIIGAITSVPGSTAGSTTKPNNSSFPSSSTASSTKSATTAAAALVATDRLALGRIGQVDLISLIENRNIATISGILGKVTSLRTSSDGQFLVIGSGIVGVEGQISIVNLSAMKIVKQLHGHQDLVYCAALSPDGKWLASGSYDRKVILWNVQSTEPAVVITSHNGPIYDLDFHPDGQMLATASGDQTIKLWKIPDGTRLDTLGQPEGEMRCVRFSANGKLLYGGGADRQVRQWLVDPQATTGSPMLLARYAHERELLRMAVADQQVITASADGTVKLWTAQDLRPLGEIAKTTSVPVAICMSGPNNVIVVDLKGNRQEIPAQTITKLIPSTTIPVASNSVAGGNVSGTIADKVTGAGRSPKTLDSKTEIRQTIKFTEVEPNNSVQEAQLLQLPAEVSGVLQASGAETTPPESDLFAFTARAGEAWEIEVFSASEKSSLDSKIDILDWQGLPVLHTRLQALRESYFTFRGKDSSTSDDFRMHKWQDMELDEYLYAGSEVTRLWLYPRGPDSGFKVYPGAGARHTFFGTTPISHPLGEPAYIVRPLQADESPVPNGLPVFPIYYENDDDPLRERGTDSRLTFRVPQDGQYFLRIRDSRGFSSAEYHYRAVIRQLQPDYSLIIDKQELSIPLNSGLEWSVKVKRSDGLDSAIAVTLDGLPEGVLATNPLIIEEHQLVALGTCFIDSTVNPAVLPIEIRLTATTLPTDGSTPIRKELSQRIKLTISDAAVPTITLRPKVGDLEIAAADQELDELTIQPGRTISARLRVERNGVKGGVGFGKEDSGRNLPHGAFVDNIGLNGLLIVDGQTEREFFITAARKVKPGRYQFHFKSDVKGNPTSKPIWLNVVQ